MHREPHLPNGRRSVKTIGRAIDDALHTFDVTDCSKTSQGSNLEDGVTSVSDTVARAEKPLGPVRAVSPWLRARAALPDGRASDRMGERVWRVRHVGRPPGPRGAARRFDLSGRRVSSLLAVVSTSLLPLRPPARAGIGLSGLRPAQPRRLSVVVRGPALDKRRQAAISRDVRAT